MGDQGSECRIDAGGDPCVPDDLIERVCQTLGHANGLEQRDLGTQLRAVAVQYLCDLSVEPYWGTPKEQRTAFRRLLKSLDRTLVTMSAISPEYAVALDSLIDRERRKAARESLFAEAQQNIIDLGHAVARFDVEYRPKQGRPTDLLLEEAVRKLIDIIELLTGERPRVQLNKHKGGSPTLKSPEARAIGVLLQGVDPSLMETKIAHMIEKVARQPQEGEWHLDALLRLDSNYAMDLAVRPSPEGD